MAQNRMEYNTKKKEIFCKLFSYSEIEFKMGLANPYYTVIKLFFIEFNFNQKKKKIDTMKTLFKYLHYRSIYSCVQDEVQ